MKKKPIRVLHVFSGLRRNGAESRTMDIYRSINRDEVQFDFMVHTNEECDFDKEAESLGAKIYRVPAYRIINHISYKSAWDTFLSTHTDYRIIHIHTSNIAAPILAVALKYHVKVRIVHSRNGHQSGFIKQYFLKLTRRKINMLSTHRFAVSKEAGDYVFGRGEYEIWPNAIDAKKYVFDEKKREILKKQYGLDNNYVFGHIGRFVEQKNHIFLIEIFLEILRNIPQAKLLLIGIGEEFDNIKKLVQVKGISSQVIFMGKREDVQELLNVMDVFLFPSLFEGLPGVVLEAQANGMPCLISDTITKEVAITRLVRYMSLKEDTSIWASEAVDMLTTTRECMYDVFVKTGFDITGLATKYEEFYKSIYGS